MSIDDNVLNWRSEGLTQIYDVRNGWVVCNTTHLSKFAVFMEFEEEKFELSE